MKKTKLAAIIGLSVCMLVSGCARHGSIATGSTTPSQTAGTPMTTYNREWIEKNVLTSDNKDEIDAWYFYADYIKDTPEFKAGAPQSIGILGCGRQFCQSGQDGHGCGLGLYSDGGRNG